MYIKKLQVFNYKSYSDSGSGEMEFAPGVNIIVGKNNAGKTSLLEVLTLDFEDHPHRSIKTVPYQGATIEDKSTIEITWEISTEEVRNFIKNSCFKPRIPAPLISDNALIEDEAGDLGASQKRYIKSVEEAFNEFKHQIENEDLLKIEIVLYSNLEMNDESLKRLLNFELFPTGFHRDAPVILYQIKVKAPKEIALVYDHGSNNLDNRQGDMSDSIGYQMFKAFSKSIYRFKAERIVGICKFENNRELKSDASNLAEVISILQRNNPGLFAQFNELVSSILTEIKYISVSSDNSDVEIKVWMLDINLNRDYLSLPLSSCGSGVSQVLAILYILVTSIHEPRTIIIDEPQSFLHPGAAKKLIETIKQFSQHQYFISTHSPDIITAADPSNIINLKYENCETTASVVNSKEIESQKEILAELGVRLSDVFGADSILWVEGETEENCFPLIIDKFLANMPLKGMKILRVDSVSALLDGKHASLVARLHTKLTSGIGLIPEKSIFIFDREGKAKAKIQELENKEIFKKKIFKFLERPMYENYILNPEAISAIINEEREKTLIEIGGVENADSKWLKSPITSIQVQEYFDKIQQEKQYLLKGIENDNWFFKVHGANLLKNLFQNFCGTELEFKKTTHSYKLTEWLIANQPDHLSELVKELQEYLNQDKP